MTATEETAPVNLPLLLCLRHLHSIFTLCPLKTLTKNKKLASFRFLLCIYKKPHRIPRKTDTTCKFPTSGSVSTNVRYKKSVNLRTFTFFFTIKQRIVEKRLIPLNTNESPSFYRQTTFVYSLYPFFHCTLRALPGIFLTLFTLNFTAVFLQCTTVHLLETHQLHTLYWPLALWLLHLTISVFYLNWYTLNSTNVRAQFKKKHFIVKLNIALLKWIFF